MSSSPQKSANTVSSSSRVIDSLQSTIDKLTDEITTLKQNNQETTKKNQILSQRNESFVDQVANLKHENEMLNAMLKRKDRRIADLETQNNEMSSTKETAEFQYKQLKLRCENLASNSDKTMAEYEGLKISYDALVTSCKEYKQHYKKEIETISENFENYKTSNLAKWEELQKSISSNDKDVDILLDSLGNKKKSMDNIYVQKNTKILQLLTTLANLVKSHGQESKQVLTECTETIDFLLNKYPDLNEQISQHEQVEIDINSMLLESKETLNNTSFDDEEVTLIHSPDLDNATAPATNTLTKSASIRRKSKRYSSISNNSSNSPSPKLPHSAQYPHSRHSSQHNQHTQHATPYSTTQNQAYQHPHSHARSQSQSDPHRKPAINNNLINTNKSKHKNGTKSYDGLCNGERDNGSSNSNGYNDKAGRRRSGYFGNSNKVGNGAKNKRNSQIIDQTI
ncbi:SHE3 [Candida theae]|uniref:SWI5-dependent HO expression protein 3 n=1 Tax=Candida theae TaxID=1198502 RepID=A0AAD5BC02_9ASCO|nr:SHE3 [Candida theae]KAI5950656.1 SHE3 [Candida theae]